jgi:ubiquitin-conjugating enzyme E2 R
MFKWKAALMIINSDSVFNGGYFAVSCLPLPPTHPVLCPLLTSNSQCEISFPQDYPYSPPNFRFIRPPFHPNIYANGQLCISILHSANDDGMSGEEPGERWTPLQTAESVFRSILLLLDDPEINSPANVDASVMYRDHREEYNKRAAAAVMTSKNDIPKGFVVPTTFVDDKPEKNDWDDEDFYAASDDEDFDFDEGSDSDGDMNDVEDDEEEDDDDDDDDPAEGESNATSRDPSTHTKQPSQT